jgi:hypothetical protein
MRFDFPARPPFSLSQVIRAHGWPQLLPFHWDRASGERRRVDRLPSGAVVEAAFKDWGRWKALAYLFWEWSEQ